MDRPKHPKRCLKWYASTSYIKTLPSFWSHALICFFPNWIPHRPQLLLCLPSTVKIVFQLCRPKRSISAKKIDSPKNIATKKTHILETKISKICSIIKIGHELNSETLVGVSADIPIFTVAVVTAYVVKGSLKSFRKGKNPNRIFFPSKKKLYFAWDRKNFWYL